MPRALTVFSVAASLVQGAWASETKGAEAATAAELAPAATEAPVSAACAFGTTPDLPYYWDPTCTLQTPGCWADSAHVECRFCGAAPYTGVPCPSEVTVVPSPAQAEDSKTPNKGFLASGGEAVAESDECDFANPPVQPYYWEPQCRVGMIGCNADNIHPECRFCGTGAYASIPCRPSNCIFANPPRTPYYWDEHCAMNVMGCNADAQHVQCRFCVVRPFNTVNCPASLLAEPGKCTFPGLPPTTPYFWDPTCEFGTLGCWADGLHAECRWCGVGAYKDVACP